MRKSKYLLLGLLSAVLLGTAVFAGDIEMKINGATDAVTIDKSDGSEAMRVTADGKVGIGTTPRGALEIYGDSLLQRTVFNFQSDNSGDTFIRGGKSTSRILLGQYNSGDVSVVNTGNLIKTGGNVGIGTTTPSTKLTVALNSNTEVRVHQSTSGGLWGTNSAGNFHIDSDGSKATGDIL